LRIEEISSLGNKNEMRGRGIKRALTMTIKKKKTVDLMVKNKRGAVR